MTQIKNEDESAKIPAKNKPEIPLFISINKQITNPSDHRDALIHKHHNPYKPGYPY